MGILPGSLMPSLKHQQATIRAAITKTNTHTNTHSQMSGVSSGILLRLQHSTVIGCHRENSRKATRPVA